MRLHPNPFFFVSADEFNQAVAELDTRIPALTENQVVAELHRMSALLSQGGRDGHSGMTPLDPLFEWFLPIRTHIFSDGLFILQARGLQKSLRKLSDMNKENILEQARNSARVNK